MTFSHGSPQGETTVTSRLHPGQHEVGTAFGNGVFPRQPPRRNHGDIQVASRSARGRNGVRERRFSTTFHHMVTGTAHQIAGDGERGSNHVAQPRSPSPAIWWAVP